MKERPPVARAFQSIGYSLDPKLLQFLKREFNWPEHFSRDSQTPAIQGNVRHQKIVSYEKQFSGRNP